jgi:hypothetical protein
MEWLSNILEWLIPSGALGTIAIWLTSKTVRAVRTTKEVHDTYKDMYDDIRSTLIDLQNENEKLYRAVARLERVLARAYTCRYYGTCPMRDELQRQKADTKPRRRSKQSTNRQREPDGRKTDESDPDPGVAGNADTED